MMASLLADRFLHRDRRWFDIASGDQVALRLCPAGPLRQQIAWAEQCAMQSRLRHSLLNPLLDFGIAGPSSFFEAYAALDPVAAPAPATGRWRAHARRFLRAHGVSIDPAARPVVYRRLRRGIAGRRQPVGITLQPRRTFDSAVELFSAPLAGGVRRVSITGAAGSGLRTLSTLVAQAARREGFVPVCPAALLRWPELTSALQRRHVCLLLPVHASTAELRACASFLAGLAVASARPHVCFTFARDAEAPGSVLPLTGMGSSSMTSMLYIDSETGPTADKIFEALRRADGLPGRFLAQLGADGFEPIEGGASTVHERAAPFAPDAEAPIAAHPPVDRPRSRLGTVLWRASARARAMEARGRHAAAWRLLHRAARVLEGRGNAMQAAHCWRTLAWLARGRGALDEAAEHAERARQIAPTGDAQAAAALILAICATDREQFVEAESMLRTLVISADAASDPALRAQCELALARVMCALDRGDEAASIVEPLSRARESSVACEAYVLLSRAHLVRRDIPAALVAGREAERHAASAGSPQLWVRVHRALAEALHSAGDLSGVRSEAAAAFRFAGLAHRPLAALRVRAVLVAALRDLHGPAEELARARRSLMRVRGRPLPPLLRSAIDAACASSAPKLSFSAAGANGSAALEHFLDVAQRSDDERGAVGDVVGVCCERVGAAGATVAARDGRILATSGRLLRETPAVLARALASGQVVAPGGAEPPEAAVPIRCGGALVGVLACRWLVGTDVSSVAVEIMRAAALAVASHVRAVVEDVPIEPAAATPADLIGESPLTVSLREAIVRASRAPFPVLIEGESGSGKELVARAIHRYSPRHMRKFCAINCAALSDELIEAELFGHTRGAFTGATAERAGLFEEADGGTLFLDEVGELAARAQAKLLRVLQEGEVRRVGENLPRRVDVRIVSATNRRLGEESAEGRFRVDLRFRLDVLRISVPPLRERFTDIPLLAQHFWRQACARVGSQATLGPEALATLGRYDWPGNVRELQNVIAWMAVHAPRRGRVGAATLPAHMAGRTVGSGGSNDDSFEAARTEFERRYVRAALARAGGRRQAAAKALGVSRQGLAKMLRRLGIDGAG